jgi:hypothetical protein
VNRASIGGRPVPEIVYGGVPSVRAAFVVCAAGIAVQMAVFAIAAALLYIFGAPTTLPLKCIVMVFTAGNILIMILNLLPFGGRDGALMLQALGAMRAGR